MWQPVILCEKKFRCTQLCWIFTHRHCFLFLILDFLTFSIHSNEFSNAVRKKGTRHWKWEVCLHCQGMSRFRQYEFCSVICWGLSCTVRHPSLAFYFCSCYLQLPDNCTFTHFSIPFTMFQFLPLICCFILFFSPQPYHATLPLLFPLLCLLSFLGSYLLSADHPSPVTPGPPDPVPISFAFSE